MKILILDTETTGFKDNQPIELAYLHVNYPSLGILESYNQQYQPSVDIEFGAMAVHNICMEDLLDKPPIELCKLPNEVEYLIGHNIDFDWKVLKQPNVKRIDTLALSRHLFPDLNSHTQSAMLYYFMGVEARPLLKEAHNALCDVHNCLRLLQFLLEICAHRGIFLDTIEDLHAFSEIARIPTKITFGKFKGQPLVDIPKDYITWLRKQPDLDEYLKKALDNLR